MPVVTAMEILQASGQLKASVSASTVSRQLHARRMHPDDLALPTPSVQLRSLHPNHVWQVDSTTGAYYYLPGGRLRWMPEDEFYKNKVANLVKASSDLLTTPVPRSRCVITWAARRPTTCWTSSPGRCGSRTRARCTACR
jgi:hypothetical protein